MSLSIEEVTKRVKTFESRNIKMISDYRGVSKHHDFSCIKTGCHHVWKTSFDSVVRGSGCAKCSGNFIDESYIQLKIDSLESTRHIKSISTFRGTKKQHEFECTKISCSYKWNAVWGSVVTGGTGCPKCAGKVIDQSRIQKIIQDLRLRSIKMLSSYSGSMKFHEFECDISECRHKWSATWNSVIDAGTGCPKCSGTFIDDAVIQKRIASLNLRSIKVISEYKGSTRKHDFECEKLRCKCIWQATWDSVVNAGNGCPKCAGRHSTNEEKSANAYRNKIRNRISGLYKNGLLTASVHKDGDYMAEILTYCKTEFIKLPVKPNDDQIWNLDHIIPVTKFDHADIEQIKLCWDARNLQWLPAKVNRCKYSKLMPKYFTDWHYEVLDKLGLSV